MDFLRTSVTNHADDLPAGGAAHYGIVDQDHPFAFEQAVNSVQFQLHPEVADRLLRLDESTSDVVVANEAKAKRNTTFGSVSDGCGIAGIRDGHDDIGVDWGFARELASHGIAALIDRAAKHQAVGTRKINVFKDATRLRRRRRIETRADAFGPNDDQFAGFDVAFVGSAKQIKCAGFRGKDDRILLLGSQSRDAAHCQWAKPARIAGSEYTVTADHHQGKRAFHATQAVGDGIWQRLLAGQRDQVNQHFRVAVGLEDRALALQLRANRLRVYQVAIMSNRNRALVGLHHDGLGIQQGRIAGRRISGVADSQNAAQRSQHVMAEDIRDQPHGLVLAQPLAVRGDDARRFLSTMLESMQSEISKLLGLRMGVDGDHAAFITKFVGSQHLAVSL